MLMLEAWTMEDLPTELKKFEDLANSKSRPKNNWRFYELDWYMIHWLLELKRKEGKSAGKKTNQMELIVEHLRAKLTTLYNENRDKIEKLRESALRHYNVNLDDDEQAAPKKGKK